jgi:hypothetical protein
MLKGMPSPQVSGSISYNGEALDRFIPQRTAAYVDQVDNHMGELTVRCGLSMISLSELHLSLFGQAGCCWDGVPHCRSRGQELLPGFAQRVGAGLAQIRTDWGRLGQQGGCGLHLPVHLWSALECKAPQLWVFFSKRRAQRGWQTHGELCGRLTFGGSPGRETFDFAARCQGVGHKEGASFTNYEYKEEMFFKVPAMNV